MTQIANAIPRIPAALGFGLGRLPLLPVALAAEHVARSVAKRHPAIFARLGEHAGKSFAIDPTDLPFAFVLRPKPQAPSVTVERLRENIRADAKIVGPFAALVGLLHGAYDGDALFFSGDLMIEGDVEAVLALRNALDDAEIDLLAEVAATLGPLAPVAQRIGGVATAVLERVAGVALTRGGFGIG